MNIWCDFVTAHDSRGKAVAYYPEVHWNLDDRDTISPDLMNDICSRLKEELEIGLKSARVEQ